MYSLLTRKPYDLRNNNSFKRRRLNSVWHGTKSVSFLRPKIWDLVPYEIKESESLNGFKFKIKRWVPEGCPCRICKIYLGQVGFINNIKKLVFSEINLSLLPLHTSALSFPTKNYVLLLIIVFFLLLNKLTLISFTENNCKC